MNRTASLAILFLLALCSWPGTSIASGDSQTFLIAFAQDSSRLIVATERGGIRVLSVPDLKEVRSYSVEGDHRLMSAAVSPSGRWLAASYGLGELRIWDLQTGEAQPSVPIAHRSSVVYLFRPGTDTLLVYQESCASGLSKKVAKKGS
jgi:WD40 repeat protein